MWIAALLALASPGSPADIGSESGTPIRVVDSIRPGKNSGGPVSDTAPRGTDTLRRRTPPPPPPPPPYDAPPWSWEIAPHAGVLAASFQQRSRFASDLSALATADTLTTYQAFPGSDLAWKLGADLYLRHYDAFRLVLDFDWSFWSAQAMAGRQDSASEANGTNSLFYHTYSADLLTAGIGVDILIPKRILSVDAARDAFFGFRYRVGAGRLQGRSTAWGWTSGGSVQIGADLFSWNKAALSGILGWSSLQTKSNRGWQAVLWNSQDADKIQWDGGGLSLDFVLRWGPKRDSTSIMKPGAPPPDQKK